MTKTKIDTAIGEYLIPREEEIIKRFVDSFQKHFEIHHGSKDKVAQRAIHAKSHGLLKAKLEVFDHGDAALQYSIFKSPKTYDAIVRISNGDGPAGPDTKKIVSMGFAIKVLNVTQAKFLPEQTEDAQDFLYINQPAYMTKDVRAYDSLMQARDGGVFKKAKALLRNQRGIRYRFKASPKDNPLNTRYWSASPFKLGNTAIKYMIIPVEKQAVVENAEDDGLKPLVWNQITQKAANFDFYLQKRLLDGNEKKAMPIEDYSVEWSEQKSKPVLVGRLHIPQQEFDETLNARGEHMVFSPWTTTKDFNPLGSLNRARKVIYHFSASRRRQLNKERKF